MKRVVLNIHERQEEEDYQGIFFNNLFFMIEEYCEQLLIELIYTRCGCDN